MSDQWGDGSDQEARAEDDVQPVDTVAGVTAATPGPRRRRQRVAVAAIVAGLLGGLAVGLTLGTPGVANSQSATTSTTTSKSTNTGARDKYLQSVLAPLVKNGTITQAQADAVVKQLDSATKQRIGNFARLRGVGDVFNAAAKKIGVTEDALKTALRNGQSIADVAKSKHIDPNAVVDAMVASVKTDLDQAVKNGKLTATTEQTQLNNLKTTFTAIVNGKAPQGFGFGFRFGHRFKGQGGNSGGSNSGSSGNKSGTTENNAGFGGAPFPVNTI
jgi:hypothetical protein